MAFEPAVAVFDACILYPFHLRNIVVQAAVDNLVEARLMKRDGETSDATRRGGVVRFTLGELVMSTTAC